MFHQLFSTKLDSSAPISSKQAVKTQESFVSAQFLFFSFSQAKVAALDNAGFYDPFHAEKARQGADKMNNIIAMYTR